MNIANVRPHVYQPPPMDGIVAVTGEPARIFFLAYYVVTVVVLFNLVVSYVLEK